MAVYDLEEQEQIAEIKAWWAQNGNRVVTLLLVAALGFAGWTVWGRYQGANAADAGALYGSLQQAAGENDAQQSRKFAGKLISEYGGTVQAQLGALLSAGVQLRNDDLENMRPQLEWAASQGKDADLRNLARLKLAAMLLHTGAAAEALAQLQPVPEGPWRVRFEDLRGDVLAEQGKTAEARTAWQAALGDLGSVSDAYATPMRAAIRAKLESLEG